MSIMARRGEYQIKTQVIKRQVTSHSRTHGVTFSPSSSLSRVHVVDSGRRYEIRLVRGRAEIRLDEGNWEPLRAGQDSWSGEKLPWGVSYHNKREGEPLESVRFDMIAVGRGRILAKERNTDRVFHLKLDELFRTRSVSGPGITGAWVPSELRGDPPVPSNYFKLDPEFFTPAGSGFRVPDELRRNYAAHPASLRFPLFVEAMKAETSDGMVIPVKRRVWQLIDSRSPLSILDLNDLKCIGDAELRQVATKTLIREIITSAYLSKKEELEQAIEVWAQELIEVDFTPPVKLPAPIDDAVEDVGDMLDSIGDVVDEIEKVPLIGWAVRDIRNLIDSIWTAIASVPDAVASALESFAERVLADVVKTIAGALMPFVIDRLAHEARQAIRKDGFAALFYPGIMGLGLLTKQLVEKGALKAVPSQAGEGPPTDSYSARDCGQRSQLRLHIDKTAKFLLNDEDNPALRRLVQRLVEAGRRRRGVTIPNAPPSDVPSYTHVVYERVSDDSETHERRSIAFTKVLDLGVGYSHWHEHWQPDYGGEMHNLLATRPLFQQERYNLIQYRLLNGPVVDGDGYNDGTTNFYMLVELDEVGGAEKPGCSPVKYFKMPGRPTPRPVRRYAILWIDEQTYFSQRWRLLHPTKDTEGDLFSLQRVLRDNPEYFRFDVNRFWCPFENDCINESSRMAVARQIVAVTGREPCTAQPEIYTICFNYGVCDYSWRWRPFPTSPDYRILNQELAGSCGRLPNSDDECLYTNTLGLREDATLHLRGFKQIFPGRELIEGRWFQKYLPADLRHVPDRLELEAGVKPKQGFDHEWDFISEDAFRRADRFFLLGVYEGRIDARCQYYEVEILPDASGNTPSAEEVCGVVWRNEAVKDDLTQPLRNDTVNFNWALPRDDEGYLKLNELTVNRGQAKTMSMYEKSTRFLLLERKPKGLIAVFYDKRDDELQAASHLPQETAFVRDDAAVAAPCDAPPKGRPSHTFEKPSPKRLRVLVKANRRVINPPIVQKALVTRVLNGGNTTALRLSFWTHQNIDQVYENVWRISLAGLSPSGEVVLLFAGEVFPDFQRQRVPDRPLPMTFKAPDVLRPEYQYVFEWSGFDSATAATLDQYCTPQGRITYATSVWFEDIVGHKSVAQNLEFISA